MAISNKQKQQMDRYINELQELINEIDSQSGSSIIDGRVTMALSFAVDAVMAAREECRTRQ